MYVVALSVGRNLNSCETSLFVSHPDTMLGRMFGGSGDFSLARPNDNGDFVIGHDISASAFKAILGFYKYVFVV
jgi:hypothetical protein